MLGNQIYWFYNWIVQNKPICSTTGFGIVIQPPCQRYAQGLVNSDPLSTRDTIYVKVDKVGTNNYFVNPLLLWSRYCSKKENVQISIDCSHSSLSSSTLCISCLLFVPSMRSIAPTTAFRRLFSFSRRYFTIPLRLAAFTTFLPCHYYTMVERYWKPETNRGVNSDVLISHKNCTELSVDAQQQACGFVC